MTDTASSDGIVTHASDQSLRTDVWVNAFDGTYRLFLDTPQIAELERKCGFTDKDGNRQVRGILGIFGRVAKGRYELEGRAVGFAAEGEATIDDCRETVRLALTGGGNAIVDGERIRIDATRAKGLVLNYLVSAPIEESWNLAFLALHTAIHGRKKTEAEASVPANRAVFPGEDSAEGDV